MSCLIGRGLADHDAALFREGAMRESLFVDPNNRWTRASAIPFQIVEELF